MDEALAYRLDVLKQELAGLEASIRDHDTYRYLVKGWAISASTVLAGFAAQGRRPAVAFVGAGAMLAFWLLEA
ncbi:MAG TPA: hypothetical protein VE781_02480, partial [Kineosporiaceae bacterium]|nr:hypothetical protein [Kineosporiaceae bacterium]